MLTPPFGTVDVKTTRVIVSHPIMARSMHVHQAAFPASYVTFEMTTWWQCGQRTNPGTAPRCVTEMGTGAGCVVTAAGVLPTGGGEGGRNKGVRGYCLRHEDRRDVALILCVSGWITVPWEFGTVNTGKRAGWIETIRKKEYVYILFVKPSFSHSSRSWTVHCDTHTHTHTLHVKIPTAAIFRGFNALFVHCPNEIFIIYNIIYYIYIFIHIYFFAPFVKMCIMWLFYRCFISYLVKIVFFTCTYHIYLVICTFCENVYNVAFI